MRLLFFLIVFLLQTPSFSQVDSIDSLKNNNGPILQFDSNVIDLGKIITNRKGGMIFVKVTNAGNDTLYISRVYTSGGFYADYRFKEIPPGESDSIKVHWSYRGVGKFNRALVVKSNSVDKQIKVLYLKGEFVGKLEN